MVNRAVLMGNLTKDPEFYKSSESCRAKFTVAVSNAMKEKDGTRNTIFMNCIVFGKQAETVSKSLRKGSKVIVDGRLNQRNWEKDDRKGHEIEMIVDNVTFLDPKAIDEDGVSDNTPTFDDEAPAASANDNLDNVTMSDDDLPF